MYLVCNCKFNFLQKGPSTNFKKNTRITYRLDRSIQHKNLLRLNYTILFTIVNNNKPI